MSERARIAEAPSPSSTAPRSGAPSGVADPTERNRRALIGALAELRYHLETHAFRGERGEGGEGGEVPAPPPKAAVPPRLDRLGQIFELSSFERGVLLLAGCCELESSFAGLCARAQGSAERPYPTFSLALAALPEAHWSALSPAAPLRYWGLVELTPSPSAGGSLTGSALHLDERILHDLLGLDYRDEALAGIVELMPAPELVASSHYALARRLAATWVATQEAAELPTSQFPVLQLCGSESSDKRGVAAALCELLGVPAFRMPAEALPSGAVELDRVLRRWQREANLGGGVLVLDADGLDAHDPARESVLRRAIEAIATPLVLLSVKRRPIDLRPALAFDVEKPSPEEQREIWRQAFAEASDSETSSGEASETASSELRGVTPALLDRLIGQFHLSGPTIRAACASALSDLEGPNSGTANAGSGKASEVSLPELLWNTCRLQARPRLDDLAQRIDSGARWEDLVLPEASKLLLGEISSQVRWRHRVHQGWGFASRGQRGLGIAALFAGASGTGKTLAAEVVASEVGLDLYRIDLSSVVSKYIGETEKNLQRIFDAAESGGAILLFDEADALFGKRTEVQDSHDRYANIEVSFLLQRMESYRGLAVLTSNLKDALDPAFLRRFRFIIDFPFPGPEQRLEIWRRVFPRETPTQGLDFSRLARLNAAGGTIRNIAINAAFLAAASDEAIGMRHLQRSARREYGKLGRPAPELEIQDWV